MTEILKVLSSGGGVDSFAMLVDALDRGEKPGLVLTADTGDEWSGTYWHLENVVAPLCEREGIPFVLIDGKSYPIRGHRTLLEYFEAKRLIPSRISRLCTSAAKVERIAAYLTDQHPGKLYEVWVGFEAGEERRAEKDPHGKSRSKDGRMNRFPLIEGRICRCRAVALIKAHGLPVPPKSACWYCPLGTRGDLKRVKAQMPEQFARLERLEDNCRVTKAGKIMRFGYAKGDGTDPRLADWVEKPYTPKSKPCSVCGAAVKEPKAAGCGCR